jgi:hypothetical protein
VHANGRARAGVLDGPLDGTIRVPGAPVTIATFGYMDLGGGRQARLESHDLRAAPATRVAPIIPRATIISRAGIIPKAGIIPRAGIITGAGVRVVCGPVVRGVSSRISRIPGIDDRLASVPVVHGAGAAACNKWYGTQRRNQDHQ